MSCNGCRVLRKGCSETCVLRSCLQWIDSPAAQGNAVLFLARFFGRSDLISFVSAVPESQRPAMFQSLLYEACGRTVNPVDGAIGLLSRGQWHVCQLAVETALAGGNLRPLEETIGALTTEESAVKNLFRLSSPPMHENQRSDPLTLSLAPKFSNNVCSILRPGPGNEHQILNLSMDVTTSLTTDVSEMTTFGSSGDDRKILNLFV